MPKPQRTTLLAQRALTGGLELAILDHPVYRAHVQALRGG